MWQWHFSVCFSIPRILQYNSTPSPSDCYLGGIANGLKIHGIGTAIITLCTHKSQLLCLYVPNLLYIPDLPCNLLLPQWLVQTFCNQKNSPFHVFPKGCIFVLNRHIIPLPYHPSSNLPIFQLVPPSAESLNLPHHAYIATSNNTTALLYGFEVLLQSSKPHLPFQTLAQEYANMTQTQQDLYYWHVHLGHMNFASIQSMAWKEMGIPWELARCHPPLCWECQYGKAKWQSIHNPHPIGEWPLQPGEMCCVDQMIAGCPGLTLSCVVFDHNADTPHALSLSMLLLDSSFLTSKTQQMLPKHCKESSIMSNTVSNTTAQSKNINLTMVSLWINNSLKPCSTWPKADSGWNRSATHEWYHGAQHQIYFYLDPNYAPACTNMLATSCH